jgi:hypothetical protein
VFERFTDRARRVVVLGSRSSHRSRASLWVRADAATAVAGTTERLMSEVVARGAVESKEGFPTCPTCRSALAETLAATTLELKDGDETTIVKMAYCSRCGTALGTIP